MILNSNEIELLKIYFSRNIDDTINNLETAKLFSNNLDKQNINNLIQKLQHKKSYN